PVRSMMRRASIAEPPELQFIRVTMRPGRTGMRPGRAPGLRDVDPGAPGRGFSHGVQDRLGTDAVIERGRRGHAGANSFEEEPDQWRDGRLADDVAGVRLRTVERGGLARRHRSEGRALVARAELAVPPSAVARQAIGQRATLAEDLERVLR